MNKFKLIAGILLFVIFGCLFGVSAVSAQNLQQEATPPAITAPQVMLLQQSDADSGDGPVVRMKSNGTPIIAYFDASAQSANVYNCTNADCSTGENFVIEGTVPVSGFSIAMEIRSNGRPLITYHDALNHIIYAYDCQNSRCSLGRKIAVVKDSGLYGNFTTMTLRSNGLPLIAYYEGSTGDLRVFDCSYTNCRAGRVRTIDTKNANGLSTGLNPTISITSTGQPIIFYRAGNESEGTTKIFYFVCATSHCTAGTRYLVEEADNGIKIAPHTGKSILIRPDGRPIMSYWAQISNGQEYRMNLFDCDNARCTSGHVVYDIMGRIGSDHKLFRWTNGFPAVIAHVDTADGQRKLRLMYCNDIDCNSRTLLAFDNGPWATERLDTIYRRDDKSLLLVFHTGDTLDLGVYEHFVDTGVVVNP